MLGCDSMLDLDGEALGQARDCRRRRPPSGAVSPAREGTLYTGHWLIAAGPAGERRRRDDDQVRHRRTDAEIAAYVATGEPLSLAGSFSIDGRAAPFVDGIDGDHGNVIGLSLPLLRRLLAEVGIAITDLWRPAPAGTG